MGAERVGNSLLSEFGAVAMATHSRTSDIDFIEELRLRRWARENYVPAGQRDNRWHPVVLEEMTRKDGEGREAALAS